MKNMRAKIYIIRRIRESWRLFLWTAQGRLWVETCREPSEALARVKRRGLVRFGR